MSIGRFQMKSLLSYLGGKHLLAGKIIKRIPPHICYCEVFAGAAWVLFTKKESKVEILNDINADLVTLYRVVKHHLEEFIRYLKWILVARDEFERFKKEDPETLTDIQRAVRFYFLLKAGYSAKVKRPTFGISAQRPPRLNLLRIEEDLSAIHLRLARVYIENKPYRDVIKCFDKPTTFFYLDPPYYGHERDYGDGIFCREDFGKLRDLLMNIRGKFLLSINDHPKTREIFKGFRISREKTIYTAGHARSPHKTVTELLISNY
jgi:DNA adenine methylase